MSENLTAAARRTRTRLDDLALATSAIIGLAGAALLTEWFSLTFTIHKASLGIPHVILAGHDITGIAGLIAFALAILLIAWVDKVTEVKQ